MAGRQAADVTIHKLLEGTPPDNENDTSSSIKKFFKAAQHALQKSRNAPRKWVIARKYKNAHVDLFSPCSSPLQVTLMPNMDMSGYYASLYELTPDCRL